MNEKFAKGQAVTFRQGCGPLQCGVIDCRITWVRWLVVLPNGTRVEVVQLHDQLKAA